MKRYNVPSQEVYIVYEEIKQSTDLHTNNVRYFSECVVQDLLLRFRTLKFHDTNVKVIVTRKDGILHNIEYRKAHVLDIEYRGASRESLEYYYEKI